MHQLKTSIINSKAAVIDGNSDNLGLFFSTQVGLILSAALDKLQTTNGDNHVL